jgi:hypothetical protein
MTPRPPPAEERVKETTVQKDRGTRLKIEKYLRFGAVVPLGKFRAQLGKK